MFASDDSYEEGIEGDSAGSEGDTPNTSGGITLRPYQHAAIQACVDAFDSGLTRIGVSSPTGSGKTTMFMKLIPKVVEKQLGDKVERKQTLIIVNSVELARQSKNAAERLLPEGWTVEVEQGSSIASGRADV
jgi:ATP-dependent helicase IRC3